MKGFPHETPNPSSVFAIEAAPVPIGVAPGVILTAPEIKGGDVHKIIMVSLVLTATVPDRATFTCYRDGTQLTTFYSQDITEDDGVETVTMHWYDDTPGKGKPVYTVQAQSTGGNASTGTNSRISVFNT